MYIAVELLKIREIFFKKSTKTALFDEDLKTKKHFP